MSKLYTITRSSSNVQANVKAERIIDRYNNLDNEMLEIATAAEGFAKTPSQFWDDITGESRGAFFAYADKEGSTYVVGVSNDRAWMPKLDYIYNHSARIKAFLKIKLAEKLAFIKRGL